MAVSMSDPAMEPGLTQAVRIVLKYEIQTLLTRLADTGEEYIVLTASTDERTCGHIGSAKGEGFVQSSCLENVKEEFLTFCTVDTNTAKVEEKSIPAVTVTQKQHRRKSTPRCKPKVPKSDPQLYVNHTVSQNDSSVLNQSIQRNISKPNPELYTNHSMSQNDVQIFAQNNIPLLNMRHTSHSSDDNINTDESGTSALDLSEKKVHSDYSYTLGFSNESPRQNTSSATPENTAFSVLNGGIEENESGGESMSYTWKEEKIDLVTDGTPGAQSNPNITFGDYSSLLAKCGGEADSSNFDIKLETQSNQFKESSPVNVNQVSPFSVKPRHSRGRRRTRKSLLKAVGNLSAGLDGNQQGAFNDDIKLENEEDMNLDLKSPGKITDMKSSFQEIGNMAKCLICNKILANKNNRTFHWRSHVGDKRYTCDICNKAFTHPSNMRSHRKIHTDEKPFPCTLCDRRFRRRDYLLQHLERFHYNQNQKMSESVATEEGMSDNMKYTTNPKMSESLTA